MGAWVARAGVLVVVAATACRDYDVVPVQEFAVPRCGASAIAAARERPPGEYPYERWAPPQAPPVSLHGLPLEVHGADVPPVSRHEWDAAAIAATEWTTGEDGVPRLYLHPGRPLDDASRLRLMVRAGAAPRIEVIVSGRRFPSGWDHRHRSTTFSFDGGSRGDEPIELTVDLARVLGANWGDDLAAGESVLRVIEIALPDGAAEGFSLDGAVIDAHDFQYTGPAAWILGQTWGRLRPALYVRGGSSARVALRLPDDARRLSWFEGLDLGSAMRIVRIVVDGESRDLAVGRGRAYDWTPAGVSVAEWAGKDVVLEFAAEGKGVALFGTPRIERKPPRPPPAASRWARRRGSTSPTRRPPPTSSCT